MYDYLALAVVAVLVAAIIAFGLWDKHKAGRREDEP